MSPIFDDEVRDARGRARPEPPDASEPCATYAGVPGHELGDVRGWPRCRCGWARDRHAAVVGAALERGDQVRLQVMLAADGMLPTWDHPGRLRGQALVNEKGLLTKHGRRVARWLIENR